MWTGACIVREGLDGRQRGLTEHSDTMRAERGATHFGALGALRGARWELRGIAGWGVDAPEGALEGHYDAGALGELSAGGYSWRGATDLRQSFNDDHFGVPMSYRHERLSLGWGNSAEGRFRLRLRAEREAIVAEAKSASEHNLPYVLDDGLEVSLEHTRSPRVDIVALARRATIELTLTSSYSRWAEVRDIDFDRWEAECGWRPWEGLRLAAGIGRRRLRDDSSNYVDLWPFSGLGFLDVSRYRSDRIDFDWIAPHVRAMWAGDLPADLALELDLRYEWWTARGEIAWKERVPVEGSIFPAYRHHTTALDWPFENGLGVDASLLWRPCRSWVFDLSAGVATPIPESDGGSYGGPGSSRAGLSGALGVEYSP